MSRLSNKFTMVNTVVEFFDGLGQKKVNKALNKMLFDPDSASAIDSILKGRVDVSDIDKVLNNKIIKLSDYMTIKKGRAASAAWIMATSERNRDSD